MPTNYSVRITLPFSDISGTVREWALKVDNLACYEHTRDSGANRTHCHLLLMFSSVETDGLKAIMKQTTKSSLMGNGNSFWSFKTKSKKHGPITPETAPKFITYMSKGVFDPKYVKGYDEEFIEARKAAWETPDEVKTRNEQLYELFNEQMYYYCRDNPNDCIQGMYILRHDKADACVARARSFSYQLHKDIWDVQTARVAKMFFLTYCMRHNLFIDEQKYKVW